MKFNKMSTSKMNSGHDFPADFGFGGGKGVAVRPHVRAKPTSRPNMDRPRNRYAQGGSVNCAPAVHKHEKNMHPGSPLTKLAKGGVPVPGRKPVIRGC